jgi:hypothetical protein
MNNTEPIMNLIILFHSQLHFLYYLHDVHDTIAYFGAHACLKAKTNQQQYIKLGV